MAPNKQKILAAAQKYVQKGNLARAIKEYTRLLELDPADVRIRLKVGDLQGKKGDIEEAIQTYRHVAKIHAKSGFLLKSAAVYKRILQLRPKHIATQLRLGEVYHQLGLMSDAMSYFNTASNIAVAEGDIAAYADILRKMIQVDPENIGIRIKLAEHYSKNELIEEAIEEFQRAATMLQASGRMDDYVKVAERLVYLKPNALDQIMDLVKVYMDRREHKRALAKLQVCFNADPEDVTTLGLLAEVFKALSQKDKAVQVLREKARIHARDGQEIEAQGSWREILKHAPDDPEAAQALGLGQQPALEEMVPLLSSDILAPLENADLSLNLPGNEAGYHPPASHVMAAIDRGEQRPNLAISPPALPAQIDVSRLLVETDVFIRYKLFDQACDHLEKIFEVEPENLDAMDRMKQIHVASGNLQQAVDELLNMARVVFQTDYHEGVACLREALRLVPGHAGALDYAVQYGVRQQDLYDHLAQAHDYNAGESVEDLMAQIREEVGEDQRQLGAMTLDGDDGFRSDTDMYRISELTDTGEFETAFEMSGPVDEIEIDLDDDDFIIDDDVEMIQVDMGSDDLDDLGLEFDDAVSLPEVADLAGMLGPNVGDTTAQFDLDHMMEMASRDAAGYQDDDDDDELFLDDGIIGSANEAVAGRVNEDPTWIGKLPNEVREAVSESYPDYPESLRLDLEEVDFYEEQGMIDDVRATLLQLRETWRNHPEIESRLARMGVGPVQAPAYAPTSAPQPHRAGPVAIPDGRILALIPPHEEVSSHFDLGIAYREMKLFEDAIGEFNLAIDEGLQVPHSHQLVGQSHLDLGQIDEAVYHLQVSLAHAQPVDLAAYAQYRLGLTYELLGNADDAMACFAQIAERHDLFPDIQQRMGGLGR